MVTPLKPALPFGVSRLGTGLASLGAAAPALGQASPALGVGLLGPGAGGAGSAGRDPLSSSRTQAPLPDDDDYTGDASSPEDDGALDVTELRKQFTDYVTIKQAEIREARTALRYYHGDQWTKEQLDTLQARGQPAITFNRVGRKIDGLVGVLEKLRGDPKAAGRIENNEQGAELATQCIRYALDMSRFAAQETEALRKGACTGIVIAELGMVQGDKLDPDIDLASVDATTFFYDPRSLKLDFSDARYMGVSKLVTQDEFEELFPGKWDEALSSVDDTGETEFDLDRSYLWSQGRTRLRLVEHWYRAKGDWHFAFYAGTELLRAGRSPFFDEKGKTVSRYDAFAVHVDEAGDHYGFVRNLIGPQDAMNQHRSKSVHIMNTRQLKVNRRAIGGDQPDIETLRREAARPDGVMLYDGDPNDVEVIEGQQEFIRQTQYYQDAKDEIEQFGPNPQLIGGQAPGQSGRAFAMAQQSGIAELGPFLSQWRAWKLRLYRKIWVAQQRNWTAERILRVTNDQGAARYMTINTIAVDPYGRPMLVNAIGQIDVDILIDEGPDTTNVMGDVFDTLQSLAQNNVPVPPAVIIEASALPQSKKQQLISMLSQQDPQAAAAQQQAVQAALANKEADTLKKQSDAKAAEARAVHSLALAHHETLRAHATSTGTAIDTLEAAQAEPQPIVPEGATLPMTQGGPKDVVAKGAPQPAQVAVSVPARPVPGAITNRLLR
ncbi:MAG: hypothetical protein JO137_17020 [Hyphomicrobiales bacterium]|nr:hypothetical protein [Hyphomicrobiales bacterium]